MNGCTAGEIELQQKTDVVGNINPFPVDGIKPVAFLQAVFSGDGVAFVKLPDDRLTNLPVLGADAEDTGKNQQAG